MINTLLTLGSTGYLAGTVDISRRSCNNKPQQTSACRPVADNDQAGVEAGDCVCCLLSQVDGDAPEKQQQHILANGAQHLICTSISNECM